MSADAIARAAAGAPASAIAAPAIRMNLLRLIVLPVVKDRRTAGNRKLRDFL
jgi:hypothetical protein